LGTSKELFQTAPTRSVPCEPRPDSKITTKYYVILLLL
jgi:hypothetical protein